MYVNSNIFVFAALDIDERGEKEVKFVNWKIKEKKKS